MSSQTLDKLIYMANQIGREFANQHPDEAAEATYDHLWHFWDPRMRGMIVDYAREDGERLNEVARAAVARLASGDHPESVTKSTKFNKAGDHEGDRNLMSDAG